MKGIFRIQALGGEDMVAEREIPFVPVSGQLLAVTSGGDYLSVDEVYWNCEQPDELTVYMQDSSGTHPAAYLREQGWRLE